MPNLSFSSDLAMSYCDPALRIFRNLYQAVRLGEKRPSSSGEASRPMTFPYGASQAVHRTARPIRRHPAGCCDRMSTSQTAGRRTNSSGRTYSSQITIKLKATSHVDPAEAHSTRRACDQHAARQTSGTRAAKWARARSFTYMCRPYIHVPTLVCLVDW